MAPPEADVAGLAAQLGVPCVLKPVSLSGGTGVIRADTPAEAAEVAERIRAILVGHGHPRDEPLLLERFVPGDEVALEGLLRRGALDVLALFDKPDPLDGPYFEETIYVTPSRLPADHQNAVVQVVEAACSALGLREGPIHAEVRLARAERHQGRDRGQGEPVDVRLLEVAARSIGGLCSKLLRFGTRMSLEELILRHALGLDLDHARRSGRAAGVMMLPIPRSGVLADVRGVDAAAALEGITGIEITATLGRPITALPEGGRYLGFVFAESDTPAGVEAALRMAHSLLDVVIADNAAPAPHRPRLRTVVEPR
ncbi:MAG: ATP-grasp domain-containing protein [Microthrixaceae bacterium]